ncbi:glycosyltransferase [Achaetomium macrosporum]|uniref:Glycosyltransferase n=1 Tax=Achaetomium macrosporum TaxID=79813 RepID=A0AAN7HAN1_9PEZI|nr:glycosyltransferase [Achaetomium macrosporum]
MAGSGESRRRNMMRLRALFNMGVMAATVMGLHTLFTRLSGYDSYLYFFLCLFTWRYARLVINLVAFWCYASARCPRDVPTYVPARDVTAVMPTVTGNPDGADFQECLVSCAQNGPAKIVIVTAGEDLYAKVKASIRKVETRFPLVEFVVDRTQVANKRAQVAHAIPHIDTPITVLLDDHVFWGPRYLQSVLCGFEDASVGIVGTNKRVRRIKGVGIWGRIWNMLGATYLYRHNFEIRATNTVDGGVFVISGRTCAIRTEILRRPEFLRGYTNERFFFGLFGPLNPDDDNYITRFVVRHGWKIKIQYCEDAAMETTIGVEKPLARKFLSQCRRWARTTWRSNLCSLVTDRTVWATQPYCVYAVYLTSLTNFAAVVDPLLIYLLIRSYFYSAHPYALPGLVTWILLTKTVRVFDYFRRHPQDIICFPVYLLFGYFHSLIKLWALLTFWDCNWSGRRLDKIKIPVSPKTTDEPTSTDTASDNPGPVVESDHHPSVSTLRALRIRVAALHAQHMTHIESYQLPLLAALKQLTEAFETLHCDQRVVGKHQEDIRSELQRIVQLSAAAREAHHQVGSGNVGTTEVEIAKALEEVQRAVDWINGRRRSKGKEKKEKVVNGTHSSPDSSSSSSIVRVDETQEE